jgi:hypothetical protein
VLAALHLAIKLSLVLTLGLSTIPSTPPPDTKFASVLYASVHHSFRPPVYQWCCLPEIMPDCLSTSSTPGSCHQQTQTCVVEPPPRDNSVIPCVPSASVPSVSPSPWINGTRLKIMERQHNRTVRHSDPFCAPALPTAFLHPAILLMGAHGVHLARFHTHVSFLAWLLAHRLSAGAACFSFHRSLSSHAHVACPASPNLACSPRTASTSRPQSVPPIKVQDSLASHTRSASRTASSIEGADLLWIIVD